MEAAHELNITALYIGVTVYFACMIMVGFLVRKKASSAEGYLVAGRQFGLLFNSAALTACFLGGTVILSLPGLTYGMGLWSDDNLWGATAGLGGIFCLLLAGLFYMPKLWRLKLLSLGDYFYLRFGKATGFTVSLVTILTFIFWVAVQILVFAKVCNAFMGWGLIESAVVGIAVIAIYTTLGGLWAVMATDMVQVGLVALGIFVLTPIALGLAGGFDAVMATVPEERMHILPQVSEPRVWVAWFASWCLVGIGSIVSPDLMQRAFAAKTATVARNSALVGMTIKIVLSLLMMLLAYAGWTLVHTNVIPEAALGGDQELIVPERWSPLIGQEVAVSKLIFSLIRLPLSSSVHGTCPGLCRRGRYEAGAGCRSRSTVRYPRGLPSRFQKRSGTHTHISVSARGVR